MLSTRVISLFFYIKFFIEGKIKRCWTLLGKDTSLFTMKSVVSFFMAVKDLSSQQKSSIIVQMWMAIQDLICGHIIQCVTLIKPAAKDVSLCSPLTVSCVGLVCHMAASLVNTVTKENTHILINSLEKIFLNARNTSKLCHDSLTALSIWKSER